MPIYEPLMAWFFDEIYDTVHASFGLDESRMFGGIDQQLKKNSFWTFKQKLAPQNVNLLLTGSRGTPFYDVSVEMQNVCIKELH